MSVQIEVSQVINRPVDKVFRFMVYDHVRNHPRWDPDMELEQITEGPIRVGTMIRRRNSRSGTPVEGTMEVVELEPNHAFITVIHDGSMEMRGGIYFEAINEDQTRVTTVVGLPGMDETIDKSTLLEALERSGRIRKELIEKEV